MNEIRINKIKGIIFNLNKFLKIKNISRLKNKIINTINL